MIFFDTETYLIEPGRLAPKVVCLTMCHGTDGEPLLFVGEEARNAARMMLQSDAILVGQNTAFDMACIASSWPELADLVWGAYMQDRVRDTKLRAQLQAICLGRFKFDPDLNRKPRFSLQELAYKHIGLDLEKGEETWRLRYSELDGVPVEEWPDDAKQYALDDAEITRQVWYKLEAIGEPKDEILQVRAAWAIHLMACWGTKLDQNAVTALRAHLEGVVEEHTKHLLKVGIFKDDRYKVGERKGQRKLNKAGQIPKDQKKIRELVEKAYDGEPPKTEKGNIKTDGDTLEMSNDEDLKILADVNDARYELSNYVYAMQQFTTNHPRYDVLVRSGRTSCSNSFTGVRVQNMPRRPGVRECHVPRPGKLFVASDWSVAELCGLAEVCYEILGISKLGDALNKGMDPHLLTGADIAGWTYEQIKERYESAGVKKEKKQKLLDEEQHALDMRQLAKAPNFGLPGGLGVPKFVRYAWTAWRVMLTMARGKEIKDIWLRRYIEMPLYFDYMSEMMPGSIVQLRSNRVRGDCTYTSGCNTLFQGLIADLAKDTMWEISRLCYAPRDVPFRLFGGEVCELFDYNVLSGSRLVAFIHDEFILEVLAALAERCAVALEWIMVTVAKRWIRRVPVGADSKVMKRWTK